MIPAAVVGLTSDPIEHRVDARWIMAQAASLPVDHPAHFDPDRPGGLVAHPMLTAGLEWPAVLAMNQLVRQVGALPAELGKGVHATHDVRLARPIVEGDVLTTTATIVALEDRRPGAYQVMRFDTVDAAGATVVTSFMGSLFLGVPAEAPRGKIPDREPVPELELAHELALEVGDYDAHRYTEGARIWNPIHTDVRVARAAGLPGIILHGTATLARAVSTVVDDTGAGPEDVTGLTASFGAMVLMPSTITVRWSDRVDDQVAFEVRTEDGAKAIRDGVLRF